MFNAFEYCSGDGNATRLADPKEGKPKEEALVLCYSHHRRRWALWKLRTEAALCARRARRLYSALARPARTRAPLPPDETVTRRPDALRAVAPVMSMLDTARNALTLILQPSSSPSSPVPTPATSPARAFPPERFDISPLPGPAPSLYSHLSSTPSFAQSSASLSTSRTPLVSRGRPIAFFDLSSEHDPMPPTTNELDAAERARLLKKTRKLGRVLGEVPIPVSPIEENGFPASDAASSGSWTSPHSTFSAAKSRNFARKLSAHITPPPILVATPKRIMTRILPRPTISAVSPKTSPASSSPRLPGISSPRRAAPDAGPSTSPSVHDGPHDTFTTPPVQSSKSSPDEDEDDKDAVSIASSESDQLVPTPEQRQRARLAKLSRFLGETVPAELILHKSPGSTPDETSAGMMKPSVLSPQRPRPARRMSVDISSMMAGRNLSPARAEASTSAFSKGMRRSKSLWNIVKLSSSTPSEPVIADVEWPSTSTPTRGVPPAPDPVLSEAGDVANRKLGSDTARTRKIAQVRSKLVIGSVEC